MNVREAIAKAAQRLQKAGVPNAAYDAQHLAARLLGWSALELIAKGGDDFPRGFKRKFDDVVARRAKREPLQYVTGTVSFCGLKLDCDRRALIPRPETEALVDEILKVKTDQPARLLDACTGSGAVALALKKAWPALEVYAADVSGDALALARQNAKKLELDVTLVKCDLTTCFQKPFHFITINPPYVSEPEVAGLQPEVRDWEPRRALVAGPEGTEVLRRIPEEAPSRLWPGGLLLVELAPAQAKAFADSLDRTRAFDSIRVLTDFQGLERIVAARRWKSSSSRAASG
jgi:release factor glutamine methyltransferase